MLKILDYIYQAAHQSVYILFEGAWNKAINTKNISLVYSTSIINSFIFILSTFNSLRVLF